MARRTVAGRHDGKTIPIEKKKKNFLNRELLTNVPLAIKLMRLRMHWDIGTGSASDYVLNLIELLEGMGPAVKLRLSFDEVTDLWAVYNLLELAEENEMTEAFERLIAKCSFAEGEHTLSLLLHPINTPF